MKARLFAFALACVTCGAFAACDSAEDDSPAPATANEAGTDAAVPEGGSGSDGSAGSDSTSDASTSDADAGVDAAIDAGPDAEDAGPQPTVLDVNPTGHDRLHNVAYDAAGNLYVVGVKTDGVDASADFAPFVAKFLPAGVLDTTFGVSGIATLNVLTSGSGATSTRGIVVQSTGKIVVTGTVPHAGNLSDGGPADSRDRDLVAVRLLANGTVDTTFGGGGTGVVVLDLSDGVASGTSFTADNQWGLALAASDKLVISGGVRRAGGTDSDFAVVRLEANGALDNTFNGTGVATLDISNLNGSPRNVTVLPDDSIVLAGYFTDGASVIRPVLWKLSPSGGDAGFPVYTESVLVAQTETYGAALQDASLVTTGYGRDNTTSPVDILSLRVQADGGRDLTYGDGGFVRIDVAGQTDQSRAIAVLPDGRIVLAGAARKDATDADALVVVLLPNGAPDTSFGPDGRRTYDLGGSADFFWGVAVSPTGSHIALAGIAGAPTGGDDDGALLVLPTGL